MITRERDLWFDPNFIEIGYSKWKLWHFKVNEVWIVHFKNNAFEDIWVDDGRKPLAMGTKYKPKQMKFRKHAMQTFVYHLKWSKVLPQYNIVNVHLKFDNLVIRILKKLRDVSPSLLRR